MLTSSHTSQEHFLEIVQFLSLVRGGRFTRFIHGDLGSPESVRHIQSQAAEFQPELIIAAAPLEKELANLLLDVSRPKYLELPQSPQEKIDEHLTGGLVVWQRIVARERSLRPDMKRDNFFLLKIQATPEFLPLVAATYGMLSDEVISYLKEALNAKVHEATVSTPSELYALNRFMASRYSWLDFLNQGIRNISGDMYPPTTVLVDNGSLVRDLGLYWNLTKHMAWGGSDESLLLLPTEYIDSRESIDQLAQTLGSSKIGSNYCLICDADKNADRAKRLARRLRPRMHAIKKKTFHVDTANQCLAPISYAYDQEATLSISRDKSIISIPRVAPEFPSNTTSAQWYIDLKKDQRTNRYPFELAFPKQLELLKLLNVPAGEFASFRDLISFGYECLSVAFTPAESSETVRFQLPSEHEIFEVLLDRSGWKLLRDEKNTRYKRVLDLFESVSQAALTFTGRAWKMLSVMLDGPLTYDALRGKAKLGKRRKSEPLPPIADLVSERQRGIFKRIFEQRVRSELRASLTKDSTDENILEFLVTNNAIRRNWQLDRCTECNNRYWTDKIDVTKTLHCPGCGAYIPFSNSVKVGYKINPLVSLAIKEGFRPVLLTARFVYNLTLYGCAYYLGAKIQRGGTETDLDILAVADGSLIVGECKKLDYNPGPRDTIWKHLSEQLATPIDVAKELGAHVFVVSCLVERYPAAFQDQLKQLAGDSLRLLLLTKNDLEAGSRKIIDTEGHEHSLSLRTLLYPKKNRPSKKKKRRGDRYISY